MGESYELEEGEFNCSAIYDLDVDLSYIVSLLLALHVFIKRMFFLCVLV